MTLEFPRTWPDGIPIAKQKFDLDDNQTAFHSPFDRQTQTQSINAGTTDIWKGIWTTPTLSPAQIRTMRAWLTSLKGQKNSFYVYDYDAKLPDGFVQGEFAGITAELAGTEATLAGISSTPPTALVDGSGQTGTSMNTKGWIPSVTNMLAGEYTQFNNQYIMLLEDVVADAGGLAVINFEPAIRTSPIDGDLIITVNPRMIATMQEPYAGWETDQLKNGVISFAFEESLNG